MDGKLDITLDEVLKLLFTSEKLNKSMQKQIDDCLIKIEAQALALKENKEKLASFERELCNKNLKILDLQEKLETQIRYRFTPHSEVLINDGKSLFDDQELDEIDVQNIKNNEKEIDNEKITITSYKRRKCGRKALPEELPRKTIYKDIPEEEKICGCGANLVKIGEDKSERLQIIPAQVYVEVTIRPKYACKKCEGSGDEDKPVFRQMPASKHIIPKSIASENLLAYVFTQKYCEHNPYYRQSKAFERRNIHISRADMDNWQLKVYKKLRPMENVILKHIKKGCVLNMDETTVKIINYDDKQHNGNRKKSYMWLGIGGPRNQKVVLYKYYESRSPKFIKPFINGFTGWLQSDEYAGYETALQEYNYENPQETIIHVACLAHVRRKFFDASLSSINKDNKGPSIALNYIAKIYRLENMLKEQNLNDEDLISERQRLIKPVFDEFHDWLVKIEPKVVPSLKFGKAINYALSAWNHLLNYMGCPEVYLDNSVAERSIKPYVMGRKNWLFNCSEEGARSSCLLFTLIECAKIHKINPEDYLRCIFNAAIDTDDWTDSDWEKLLPWNINIHTSGEQIAQVSA